MKLTATGQAGLVCLFKKVTKTINFWSRNSVYNCDLTVILSVHRMEFDV